MPLLPRERARSVPSPEAGRGKLRSDRPDEELVARALAGDGWARGAIFQRYVGEVGDLATRLLGRVADADDVVQDTFVDGLAGLETLRDPRALRSWLLGIAVRRVQRRHRRRALLRRLGLDRGLDDATLEQIRPPRPTRSASRIAR